ncbi:uncharacterized protein LOC144874135 isoform X2 [Branchiostoma floridae x Branchiostoma japonicum]
MTSSDSHGFDVNDILQPLDSSKELDPDHKDNYSATKINGLRMKISKKGQGGPEPTGCSSNSTSSSNKEVSKKSSVGKSPSTASRNSSKTATNRTPRKGTDKKPADKSASASNAKAESSEKTKANSSKAGQTTPSNKTNWAEPSPKTDKTAKTVQGKKSSDKKGKRTPQTSSKVKSKEFIDSDSESDLEVDVVNISPEKGGASVKASPSPRAKLNSSSKPRARDSGKKAAASSSGGSSQEKALSVDFLSSDNSLLSPLNEPLLSPIEGDLASTVPKITYGNNGIPKSLIVSIDLSLLDRIPARKDSSRQGDSKKSSSSSESKPRSKVQKRKRDNSQSQNFFARDDDDDDHKKKGSRKRRLSTEDMAARKKRKASVPDEVKIGDREMRALYDQACKEGTCQVFHIRLILVGQHGNGKTSLTNSLLLLKFDKAEESTDGIVITPCLMTGKEEWKITKGMKDNHLAHAAATEMKKMMAEKKERKSTAPRDKGPKQTRRTPGRDHKDAATKGAFQTLKHLLTEVTVETGSDTYNRLARHVAESGLTFRDEVPKDGNCMFHAVADQLFRTYGRLINNRKLRQFVVEFLRHHPQNGNGDHLSAFVPDQNWEGYLSTMSRDGTWGDHIVLQAMADLLRHDISIVSSVEAENYVTILTPSTGTVGRKEPPLLLGHYAENHYASLDVNKKGSGTSLQQRPASQNGHAEATDSQPEEQTEEYKLATHIILGKDDLTNLVGSKEQPAMSIWDFAGHDVYYSSHHVFYSHYAIFILTLNLTKPLSEPLKPWAGSCAEALQLKTEGDLVDYHLESIRAHTRPNKRELQDVDQDVDAERDRQPPVIVVGTRKDQLKQDVVEAFLDTVKEHFKGKAISKHVEDRYFAVDNTKRDPEDPELSDLRDFILKVAQQQNHMGRTIPISWLELKSKLMEMEKQGSKYCSLQDVMDATDSSRVPEGFTPERNAVIILRFFHLCGDILFFDTQALRNFVVLDPQWFVDVQKTIITIPQFRDREVKDKWEQLEATGVLEDSLIEHVWSSTKQQDKLKCKLIDCKYELLKMMEQFDVILQCGTESEDEAGGGESISKTTTYFVPSLLTTVRDRGRLYPAGTKCSKPIFVVFDEKFFPVGVYHRLVIASMRRHNKRKPLAYARCARFITSNPKQTFVITKEGHYLKVELLSSEKEESACFSHGPSIRKGLDEDLREIINKWIPGLRYKWCLRCCCASHEDKELDADSFIPITSVPKWFMEGEVVCETYPPATTTIEDIGLAHWFKKPLKDASQSNRVAHPEMLTAASVSRDREQLLELQSEVTEIMRGDFPNLDFVPDGDKNADKERVQCVRRTLREIMFSDTTDYSLEAEVYDLIRERKKSVCRINWPEGYATGFLLSKRKILTCYHVLKKMDEATERHPSLDLYTATFVVSSVEHHHNRYHHHRREYKVSFPLTAWLCHCEDLDYAILQLLVNDETASCIDNLPCLGHYISDSVDDRNMVVVVGHPYGGSKKVDFCPIVGMDQRYIIDAQFGNPELPQEDPRKPLYHTGVMFHGASGAPGFDTNGNVMIMHTTGFYPDPDARRQSIVERGVRLSAVREHARQMLAPEVFSEIFPQSVRQFLPGP